MKLIVIDPNVTKASPTMRAWLGALPASVDLFDQVEIWSTECELPGGDTVRHVPFPQRFPIWALHSMDYQFRVCRALRDLDLGPDTLVQVTGCYAPKADIRFIHFWNRALLEEATKRPESLRFSWKHRPLIRKAAREERIVSETPGATKFWWVVSRSLAERIAAENPSGEFRIIPNQYDPDRFHAGVREESRPSMRRHHGFAETDIVLVFSAFGHFERKGLPQAVQAITELRKRGHAVKLLVLGGTEETITAFKSRFSSKAISLEGVHFAGMVDPIERHLAAADGLFFPSHFEAFSLAEIEAAALGLRLYLTPHYGHEMILREPENGRLLPWNPAGMADAIERDILTGMIGEAHSQMGEALTPQTYSIRLRELYREAIAAKLGEKVKNKSVAR